MTAKATGGSRPFRMIAGVSSISDLVNDVASAGGDLFVNANTAATGSVINAGNDANDGLSWNSPLLTMTKALSLVKTGGRIFFIGNINETVVGSNLVFDVSIIGMGSLHHPDLPSSAYHPGSSTWRNTAGDTAALLEIRGRGWNLVNIFFDAPASYAAVKLSRNALADTSEYDASHATFENCRFVDGKYGIEDSGGCYNVTVRNCEFKAMTTAAIANTSSSVANPLNWKIINNRFPANTSSFGNATHLDSPLNCAIITGNVFGTVTSTGLYVDLTGGNTNIFYANLLMGVYDTSDYVAGTGDSWAGNQTIDFVHTDTTVVNASGMSLKVPAAAT